MFCEPIVEMSVLANQSSLSPSKPIFVSGIPGIPAFYPLIPPSSISAFTIALTPANQGTSGTVTIPNMPTLQPGASITLILPLIQTGQINLLYQSHSITFSLVPSSSATDNQAKEQIFPFYIQPGVTNGATNTNILNLRLTCINNTGAPAVPVLKYAISATQDASTTITYDIKQLSAYITPPPS
jgi:hypothetical protein